MKSDVLIDEAEKARRRRHCEYQKRYIERNPEKYKETQKRSNETRKKFHFRTIILARVRRRKCEETKKGSKEYAIKKQYDKLRNEKSRTGKPSKRRWATEEINKLFDEKLSDRQLSEILGRSLSAIMGARHKNKHLAPDNWQGKATKPRGTIFREDKLQQ